MLSSPKSGPNFTFLIVIILILIVMIAPIFMIDISSVFFGVISWILAFAGLLGLVFAVKILTKSDSLLPSILIAVLFLPLGFFIVAQLTFGLL